MACFDGSSLSVSGESPFGLSSTATTSFGAVHFDGLLHNREELTTQLFERSEPDPRNDAEIVSRAYKAKQDDLLDHLVGRFSLIIWDKERSALLAVRDRTGTIPLFYRPMNGSWHFATSLNALREVDGRTAVPNRLAMLSFITFFWPDPQETIYKGVFRVPIAHQLRVSADGSEQLSRYWDKPWRGDDQVDWVTAEELPLFNELLEQAVARCLSLGPAAIYLSGGIDSVSVAAYAAETAAQKSESPPYALSLEFQYPGVNESALQRQVAAKLGMNQSLMTFADAVAPLGLTRASVQLSRVLSAPLFNFWRPAYLNIARQNAHIGYQVLLSGNGGDEWLGVSPYYAADLIRKGRIGGLYNMWRTYIQSYHLSRFAVGKNLIWQFGLRPILGRVGADLLRAIGPRYLFERRRRHWEEKWPAWLAPDPELRRELTTRVEMMVTNSMVQPVRKSFYSREGQLALEHVVMSMGFEEDYECSTMTGLPLLAPYLDAELIDFLARTPPKYLNRGKHSKGLVRETLSERFPEFGFEKHKKVNAAGFFKSHVMNESIPYWSETGGVKALDQLGVVDSRKLGRDIDQLAEGNHKDLAISSIDYLLNLESWVDNTN